MKEREMMCCKNLIKATLLLYKHCMFQKNSSMESMIDEREEHMVPLSECITTPKLRKAHFLKPIVDLGNESLPKPPSFSISSKFSIEQLKGNVAFRGRPRPQENWHLWVGSLQEIHQCTWKEVGIFDAIRASTYNLMWDNELIFGLAGNWCQETNTFVFPWGECTITLEDVMILGGFSVLGRYVNSVLDTNFIELGDVLINGFPDIKRSTQNRILQSVWMDYFMDIGGELEHTAFLGLWLSRFVFSSDYYGSILPSVMPIAVALARGTKIALAPAVLASIYRDLSLLEGKCRAKGGYNVSRKLFLYAPFQIVQLWAWERFPTLCPQPVPLFLGEPRLARWQNLVKLKDKSSIMKFETLGEGFLWRPYTLPLENWKFPEFYSDEERLVVLNSDVGEEFFTFARFLRSCELVGLDCIEQYLPQRVARQFGLDQDIPRSTPRLNGCMELAWSSFDIPLDSVTLYLSPRLFKGEVSVGYFAWYKSPFNHSNSSFSICKQHQKNHFDNSENMQCPTPYEVSITTSRESDGLIEHIIEGDSCLDISCHVSVISPTIELSVSTSSDLNTEILCIETSPCSKVSSSVNSKSPMTEVNNQPQKLDGSEKNSTQEALPCFLHSSNVAMGSGLIDSISEMCRETYSSTVNNVLNESISEEAMTFPTLELAVKNAVSGMDLQIENVDNCVEHCGNYTIGNKRARIVTEMHNEVVPSFHTSISLRKSHDNSVHGIPSQSIQMAMVNEVGSSINSTMEDMHPVIALAEVNENISKVDRLMQPNKKKLCLASARDEYDHTAKYGEAKLAKGSMDEPVIINGDDYENDENDQIGDVNPYVVRALELNEVVDAMTRSVNVDKNKSTKRTNTRDEILAEENRTSNGKGSLIDPKTSTAGSFQDEDVQHEATEDSGTQKMETAVHIVIASDGEEEGDQNSFEALCLDSKTRINRLEKIISVFIELKRGP